MPPSAHKRCFTAQATAWNAVKGRCAGHQEASELARYAGEYNAGVISLATLASTILV